MSRVFDPNTNPYADDLLRLASAPSSRFSQQERKTMASVLAGKLYGLGTLQRSMYLQDFEEVYFPIGDTLDPIAMILIFEDEHNDRTLKRMAGRLAHRRVGGQLIILSIGSTGVIEVYNGPWTSAAFSSIRNTSNHMRNVNDASRKPTDGGIPARSDKALARDYLGHDRAGGRKGGGGRGGDGGGNDGGPTGGEGSSPAAGGIGELLNHPVLFSIELHHFKAILEQV